MIINQPMGNNAHVQSQEHLLNQKNIFVAKHSSALDQEPENNFTVGSPND